MAIGDNGVPILLAPPNVEMELKQGITILLIIASKKYLLFRDERNISNFEICKFF